MWGIKAEAVGDVILGDRWLMYFPKFKGVWFPFYLVCLNVPGRPVLGFKTKEKAKNWLIAETLRESVFQDLQTKIEKLPAHTPVQSPKIAKQALRR
jgi:hypothetical protein